MFEERADRVSESSAGSVGKTNLNCFSFCRWCYGLWGLEECMHAVMCNVLFLVTNLPGLLYPVSFNCDQWIVVQTS